MRAKKVLFITQEMTPYVPQSQMSEFGRKLPQIAQEQGCEIRTFMPKWGIINERRNQLHEVIRLSGINIVIDDRDYALLIKVASIPATRIQVYFIDNDDLFHRRQMLFDANGKETGESDNRAIFYARSVLETVKKLKWVPDIIHCHGWVSALVPFYIKNYYNQDPVFQETKVLFSAYDEMPQSTPGERFVESIAYREASAELLRSTGLDFTKPEVRAELATRYSDGIILSSNKVMPTFKDAATQYGVPCFKLGAATNLNTAFTKIYDTVFTGK